MQTTAFEQLIVDVLDSLPPEFARHLDDVEILVAKKLTREDRRNLDLQLDETVYGVYEGIPLTEQSAFDADVPATIIIYQQPLEHDYPDPAELRREVRRTVLHELAHHFGISDDRLHELGAY